MVQTINNANTRGKTESNINAVFFHLEGQKSHQQNQRRSSYFTTESQSQFINPQEFLSGISGSSSHYNGLQWEKMSFWKITQRWIVSCDWFKMDGTGFHKMLNLMCVTQHDVKLIWCMTNTMHGSITYSMSGRWVQWETHRSEPPRAHQGEFLLELTNLT